MNQTRKITTPELRKRIILNLIRSREAVSVHEILRECNASEITIRRDLSELEEKGLLIRTHGGATKKSVTNSLFHQGNKGGQNKEHDNYICRVAAGHIQKGDIIFIDCGATLVFLSKYIARKESLTVITNSLQIISELINFDHIKLIVIGGEVSKERKVIYGYSAKQNISRYHVDKAFIGTNGVSLKRGLTTSDENEAAITLKMAENANKAFLLCDSDKIEQDSFISFATLASVDYIVTDKDLDPKIIERYKRNNVNIINE